MYVSASIHWPIPEHLRAIMGLDLYDGFRSSRVYRSSFREKELIKADYRNNEK